MGQRGQEGDSSQEVMKSGRPESALQPDMTKPGEIPKSGDQTKAQAACEPLQIQSSADPVKDLPQAGKGEYWGASKSKKLVDLQSADGNHTTETWASKNDQEFMTRKTDLKNGSITTEFDYPTQPRDFSFYRSSEAGFAGEDLHLKGVSKMTFTTERDHFKVKVHPPQKDASGNEYTEFRVDKTGHYMNEGY